jgi:CHAD domain-containing protein
VAPLAATLAASAALGVGVALVRSTSDRRARRARRRRGLGLTAEETLGAGLKRMALAQADLALEELERASGVERERAVHETRKAIKRMRTIVRLLEGELGAHECSREQDALRAAAAGLAGARDAEVMLSTLDGMVRRHPGKLAGKPAVARLRAHLMAERERAARGVGEIGNRLAVARELRVFRARAAAWEVSQGPGIGPIEVGFRRVYRQGRRRYRAVARDKGSRTRAMHQWRKRVKDLRYAAEALERDKPGHGLRHPRAKRAMVRRQRREARWLHQLAGQADDLGELLGEEHDLAVFAIWLEQSGKRAGVRRRTRRRLGKLIARRRAELRRRALKAGRPLHRRKPGKMMARTARAYKDGAPQLRRR